MGSFPEKYIDPKFQTGSKLRRYRGDKIALKPHVVYTREIEVSCNSERGKNYLELRDKNLPCKRASNELFTVFTGLKCFSKALQF